MSHFVRAFILLLAFVFLLSAKSLASPGDTTRVQAPRTPWGWKQRYYFDVTDFYPVLKNAATIRLSYHNVNISTKSTYNTEHKPPVHAASYYYRLKLYYADGSWKYSNNIRLSPVASSEYAVAIRPVPFDDEITIRITIRSAEQKLSRKIIKL